MPELPEVETVRRGLAPVMEGSLIRRAELRRQDLRFPFPSGFAEALEGRRVVSLGRRAKYLLIDLDGGDVVIAHLGMSGSFRVEGADAGETPGDFHRPRGKDARHDQVVFHLETADGERRVVYNDPRRFGFMVMMPHAERPEHPLFHGLGVEPLSVDLTPEYLAQRAQGKKANLKAFLMDQRIVAGLGNIYVSEALFRAGLSPNRAARSLANRRGAPTERAKLLVPAIRDVLLHAIDAGGSTLRDYRDANGASGAFQDAFAVYDRAGQVCPRPGCGGEIRRRVHAGRASFYCSRCQR